MQTPRFLYPTRRGKRMGRQENRQGPHPPQKPEPNPPPISAAQTPPSETRRNRPVSPRSDNGTGCPIASAGPPSSRRHRIPAPHFFASRSALRRTRRRSATPEDPPHRSSYEYTNDPVPAGPADRHAPENPTHPKPPRPARSSVPPRQPHRSARRPSYTLRSVFRKRTPALVCLRRKKMPLFRDKRKPFFTKQRNNYFFNTFYNYEFIYYI